MRILAIDGISQAGIIKLAAHGFEVLTVNVANEQLVKYINQHDIQVLLVNSAASISKELLDNCPNLKLVGLGGIGLDTIDLDYAKEKGIHVVHTPDACADAIAELVFAHLAGGVRFLYDSNRTMPLDGDSRFIDLKKGYAGGTELRGKTLGIIGFGKIGQATAKIALGIGMKVLYHDAEVDKAKISLSFYDGQMISFELENSSKKEVLQNADYISLDIPKQKAYVLGENDFSLMKNGVGIINAVRGGAIDEVALVDALETGKITFAGLDVFESEPKPEIRLLMHPDISLTPNIGAATKETQDRIGLELASQIIDLLK